MQAVLSFWAASCGKSMIQQLAQRSFVHLLVRVSIKLLAGL
jgi:hypothetical protein